MNNPDAVIQGYKLDLKTHMQRSLPSFLLTIFFKRHLKAVGFGGNESSALHSTKTPFFVSSNVSPLFICINALFFFFFFSFLLNRYCILSFLDDWFGEIL